MACRHPWSVVASWSSCFHRLATVLRTLLSFSLSPPYRTSNESPINWLIVVHLNDTHSLLTSVGLNLVVFCLCVVGYVVAIAWRFLLHTCGFVLLSRPRPWLLSVVVHTFWKLAHSVHLRTTHAGKEVESRIRVLYITCDSLLLKSIVNY